jgi:hypothetical protein
MAYDRGHRTCEVICRCGKRLYSFTAWKQHLQSRHPKLYQELKNNGDLEQDRIDFGNRAQKC